MQSVTAGSAMVALAVLFGSSNSVRAGENFELLVSSATGQVAIKSDFSSTVWIDEYIISSAAGTLKPANSSWTSLEDQIAAPGTWDETSALVTLLSESTVSGEAAFQTGTGFGIGPCFNFVLFTQDLVFHYRLAGSSTLSLGVVTYLPSFPPPPTPVQVDMPCLGDIDSNNLVNVDDLLAVINGWGSCSPPPGKCPADIAPSIGGGQVGNGTVNVDDLLAVIGAWGACP